FGEVVVETQQSADLRVAQFAALERRGDERAPLQPVRDPNVITRRARSDSAAPAEPVGTVLEATVAPATALIELRDQEQPARRGRGDVRRERRDLVSEGFHAVAPL